MPKTSPDPQRRFDLKPLSEQLTKLFATVSLALRKNTAKESGGERKWSSVDITAFLAVAAAALLIYIVASPREDGTLFGSYNMRMVPIDRSVPSAEFPKNP